MEIVKNESPEEYFCGYCEISLSNQKDLKNHLSSHKNDSQKVEQEIPNNAFPCEFCDKPFKNFSYLNTHKSNVHKENLNPLECSRCHKICKNKSYLWSHVNKTHNDKDINATNVEMNSKLLTHLKNTLIIYIP